MAITKYEGLFINMCMVYNIRCVSFKKNDGVGYFTITNIEWLGEENEYTVNITDDGKIACKDVEAEDHLNEMMQEYITNKSLMDAYSGLME
jgi:hypothetical protein